MSNYLARLREIETEKISDSSHINELTKPPKCQRQLNFDLLSYLKRQFKIDPPLTIFT